MPNEKKKVVEHLEDDQEEQVSKIQEDEDLKKELMPDEEESKEVKPEEEEEEESQKGEKPGKKGHPGTVINVFVSSDTGKMMSQLKK